MMAETEAENRPDLKTDSGDESDDLSEVLEESPCGRWQKRREEVSIPCCNVFSSLPHVISIHR